MPRPVTGPVTVLSARARSTATVRLHGRGPEPERYPGGDIPPHRYTAALAEEIEAGLAGPLGQEGTFHAPNPTGPLAEGFERVADRPKLYVLDMFPYPSGPACTSATHSATSAPTSTPATSG